MKVYQGFENLPLFKNPVVTIGTFDGVHAGHRSIIERIRRKAMEVEGESVLITFEPHPRLVLSNSSQPLWLLSSLSEKIKLLAALEIDHLVVVNFTKAFSELSADEYIKDFLINHFHPHTFVIGYDHHFGKGRTGNYALLEKVKGLYGFDLVEIPAQEIEHITVSSTKIREALQTGQIHIANEYLCKPYLMQGLVMHGEKRGRLLGFPTANLDIEDEHKLIPLQGVYAVQAMVRGEVFKGMLNIGIRPTVSSSSKRSIEVNLFDFDKEIYGEELQLFVVARIRDEQKFASLDELTNQLKLDKSMAIELLESFSA